MSSVSDSKKSWFSRVDGFLGKKVDLDRADVGLALCGAALMGSTLLWGADVSSNTIGVQVDPSAKVLLETDNAGERELQKQRLMAAFEKAVDAYYRTQGKEHKTTVQLVAPHVPTAQARKTAFPENGKK